MRTDCNYSFTQRAGTAINADADAPKNISFPVQDLSVTPQTGELFSLEQLMPHIFVVTQRHFHWASTSHLQINIELDLYTPEDHWVKTGEHQANPALN